MAETPAEKEARKKKHKKGLEGALASYFAHQEELNEDHSKIQTRHDRAYIAVEDYLKLKKKTLADLHDDEKLQMDIVKKLAETYISHYAEMMGVDKKPYLEMLKAHKFGKHMPGHYKLKEIMHNASGLDIEGWYKELRKLGKKKIKFTKNRHDVHAIKHINAIQERDITALLGNLETAGEENKDALDELDKLYGADPEKNKDKSPIERVREFYRALHTEKGPTELYHQLAEKHVYKPAKK